MRHGKYDPPRSRSAALNARAHIYALGGFLARGVSNLALVMSTLRTQSETVDQKHDRAFELSI